MVTVTIPKVKYEQLKRQADAYRHFAAKFFETAVNDTIEEVMEDFRRTKAYTEGFLQDLETGLRKSSYVKKHGNRAVAAGSQRVPRQS